MEVTVATLQDIPALSDLLDSLFAQEVEFIPDSAAQTKGLTEIISKPETGNILVAGEEGKIVGMVSLLYTISTALGARVALLEDMVVAPAFRGQGIGSELINYAIEFARKHGCKRITLLTDAENQGAHRFYERHGFARSSMMPFRLNLDISKQI